MAKEIKRTLPFNSSIAQPVHRLVLCDGGHGYRHGIAGRTRCGVATVPVTFDPEDATPILGAIALKALGFAPDPVGQRLLPVRWYKK